MLQLHPEVKAAMDAGRAVVALESALITHGMPYPRNLETARAAEAEVRAAGAVPATIAVIGGVLRVGLEEAELARLAQAERPMKCSRRDLAVAVATGASGGTTVAGTLAVAARAGLSVFATGGLGGVHRGAEQTMDVSADLGELARSPVAVICAGVKSILDIGLTLEVLETLGVPVIGYRTDRFPAFYLRDSGHPVEHRADDPAAVAALLRARHELQEPGGVLIVNPIPESDALAPEEVEGAIAAALAEADARGLTGKGVTPYLLSRVTALTQGRSLEANVALIRHNARVAAAIAVASASPEGVR